MIDIALGIEHLVPGASYSGSLTANDLEAYQAIHWQDERPMPTWEDILEVHETAGSRGLIALYNVPQKITRRQGRLALLEQGKLVLVESILGSIEDPAEKLRAQVEYETDTWERNSTFLVEFWLQLGGTEEELDDLFVEAATY